jgi:RNA polymerase sigma-70 factor (ECF subfamily)
MHAEKVNQSDYDVVLRVVKGDVNAFEILLNRHKNHIKKIVLRHLPFDVVEETVHDVFVRAFKSIDKYKARGGFRQWLSSIAVRTCYDYWRKAYRSREVAMSSLGEKHQRWLEEIVDNRSYGHHNEQGERQEARELLDWALARLSPKDRMALELIYFQGLSVKETSGLLGWTETNVKVRSFRSRKKLKKILSDFMGEMRG